MEESVADLSAREMVEQPAGVPNHAMWTLGLVLGFTVLGVVHPVLHVLMAVTVALSVHLLFLVIEDLDHPFYGVWNIDRGFLDALAARLATEVGGG